MHPVRRLHIRFSRGFTLVEVLVSILVIAVLSSVAIPTYSKYSQQARKVECQVSIINYLQAQEIYYGEHNSFCVKSGSQAMQNGSNRVTIGWTSSKRPDQAELYRFPELGVELRRDNFRGYRIRVWDINQPGSYRQELFFELKTDEDFDQDGNTDLYSYRKYLRPSTNGKWRVRNRFWFDIGGCPAGMTCR